MPIYEYQCGKCGHEFEREQRITEDPIRRCPGCRSLKAKRLISNTSFVLKGGGWYKDLYSSKQASGAGNSGGSDGAGAEAGSAKAESKKDSDSKSDSKSESKPDSGSSGDAKSKGAKGAKGVKAA